MSSVKLTNTPHGMTKHSIFSFWGNHNFSLQAILAFFRKRSKTTQKNVFVSSPTCWWACCRTCCTCCICCTVVVVVWWWAARGVGVDLTWCCCVTAWAVWAVWLLKSSSMGCCWTCWWTCWATWTATWWEEGQVNFPWLLINRELKAIKYHAQLHNSPIYDECQTQ